jgi:hypothetical protein
LQVGENYHSLPLAATLSSPFFSHTQLSSPLFSAHTAASREPSSKLPWHCLSPMAPPPPCVLSAPCSTASRGQRRRSSPRAGSSRSHGWRLDFSRPQPWGPSPSSSSSQRPSPFSPAPWRPSSLSLLSMAPSSSSTFPGRAQGQRPASSSLFLPWPSHHSLVGALCPSIVSAPETNPWPPFPNRHPLPPFPFFYLWLTPCTASPPPMAVSSPRPPWHWVPLS